MPMIFVPASELQASSDQALASDEEGTPFWSVSGQTGQVLGGPNLSVREGIYRVKALAAVEGGWDAVSRFEVFDTYTGDRIYATRMFHYDPEVFVRVFGTDRLEFRFYTAGETLRVFGVEFESLLLDEEPATLEGVQALARRLIAARAEPAAILRTAEVLGELGAPDAAQAVRADLLALTASAPEDVIHKRLRHLREPVSRMPSGSAGQTVSREQVRRAVGARRVEVFDLMQASTEARRRLEDRGYPFAFLEATRLHRDAGEPPRVWHVQRQNGTAAPRPPERQAMFERYAEIERSYQTSKARGLGIGAYCPVTGTLLRSYHGFLIQYQWKPFIMHRFEGEEVFYVCTGYNSDPRLFLYMPQTNTIVWMTDPIYKEYDVQELTEELNLLQTLHYENCVKYLKEPTRPVAVVGNDNYGHYFWLTVSGLQFAVENGLQHSLAAIVKIAAQFGKVEEIFPELSHLPVYNSPEREEAFLTCVNNGFLPIHFTDIAVSDALAQRLRTLAREKSAEETRPPPDVPRPLLWLNLRAHNKVWVNQVDGLANILNGIAEEYGQASALLDGVPDCAEIAAGIAERCGPKITVFNGLNFSLWDKMNWAVQSDGYICVIGTGLVICHSLAGARGVAHGNREHMTQLRFWHTIQAGSPTPLAPRMDDIHDIGTEFQRNYDVDWRILYDLILGHLRATFDPVAILRTKA